MSIIRQGKVKTRKEQCCHGCARKFEKGTKLDTVVSTDAGEIYTTYWCDTCQSYWSKHMEYDDEISYGELKSEDPTGWEEVRLTVEGVALTT